VEAVPGRRKKKIFNNRPPRGWELLKALESGLSKKGANGQ